MMNAEMRALNERGFGGCYTRIMHPDNMARDAAIITQGSLVTTPNMGVPAEMATFFDPTVITILTAPRRAREITKGREVQKGDAATVTDKFPVVELTGHTEPYNDYVDGGTAGINANWVTRENYLFSTTRRYGRLEEQRNALAKINLAAMTQRAAANIIDIDANKFYFYGVAGLKNYGVLNDPDLNANLTPAPTGTGDSPLWANKTTEQIYKDILTLFAELVKQTAGHVRHTDELTLAMSPEMEVFLATPNTLGISVLKMLDDYFTNLRIVTAPEYNTAGGELMQLFADEIDGEETTYLAFSEKMYAFPPVVRTSSLVQKFRAGTYGAIIRRPAAVASMLGM